MVFFGIYVTYILRFWALNYMTSSKTCFLYNFAPFASSLFSYFLFNERMSKKKWIGLAIGFVGMIPILLSTSPVEEFIGELYFLSWPEIAILISVASHSYSWIIMRKLVRDKSYAPSMVNGVSMFTGGGLALLTSPFFEDFAPVTNVGPFIGFLALVILISNLICYNLYGHLLKQYTATFLSFAGFLAPIFAAFYGWLFLNETITWHFYASGTVVFIGLYIFYQEELQQIKVQEEPY